MKALEKAEVDEFEETEEAAPADKKGEEEEEEGSEADFGSPKLSPDVEEEKQPASQGQWNFFFGVELLFTFFNFNSHI